MWTFIRVKQEMRMAVKSGLLSLLIRYDISDSWEEILACPIKQAQRAEIADSKAVGSLRVAEQGGLSTQARDFYPGSVDPAEGSLDWVLYINESRKTVVKLCVHTRTCAQLSWRKH